MAPLLIFLLVVAVFIVYDIPQILRSTAPKPQKRREIIVYLALICLASAVAAVYFPNAFQDSLIRRLFQLFH